MITLARALVPLVALHFVLMASAASAQTYTPRYRAGTPDPNVHRFHDVYYVQPHNTYDHGATLTGWLDRGMRSVEIDVIDRGDWEYDAKGPYVSHDGSPGQKNCGSGSANDRLGHCLSDIMSWLAAHPESEPILVLVDMKSSWDPANAWYGDEVALLDDWIRNYAGSRLYRYDELYSSVLYRSDAPRALVRDYGWPRLAELRGKMIVALTGGRIGSVNQHMNEGLVELFYDYGRYPATFLCPDVESDPSEVEVGGAIDGIGAGNSQFFLCSNLKSRDHYELTANRAAANRQLIHLWGDHVYGNRAFNYNYIAVAHGIQAVGRDLDDYGQIDTYGGSLPLVGLRRSLPGYFRLRPSSNPSLCIGLEGGYGNGSDIQQEACTSSQDQQFVYTAEGQLRPRGDNRYCVDIDGGSAGNGRAMHLWDCDGGSSEKWVITPDGHFQSRNNQSYCMDGTWSTSADQDWYTYPCANFNQQIFRLEAVADWAPTSF